MKEQLSKLIQLQKIDSEIARLKARKVSLPGEQERLKAEITAAEERFDERKKELEDLNERHRACEKEMQKGSESLKRSKSRLLEVKKNDEYQATLKEIDTIERKNSAVEDEIINLLEEIDRGNTDLAADREHLETVRKQGEEKLRLLEKDAESIDAELESIVAGERDIRDGLDPDVLRRYDLLRERRNGSAVVPVWNEVCSGCHMNIPPQLYIELRKYEKLHICPNCNRIMYWENKADEH